MTKTKTRKGQTTEHKSLDSQNKDWATINQLRKTGMKPCGSEGSSVPLMTVDLLLQIDMLMSHIWWLRIADDGMVQLFIILFINYSYIFCFNNRCVAIILTKRVSQKPTLKDRSSYLAQRWGLFSTVLDLLVIVEKSIKSHIPFIRRLFLRSHITTNPHQSFTVCIIRIIAAISFQ